MVFPKSDSSRNPQHLKHMKGQEEVNTDISGMAE